jgi:hypothetical protein
MTGKPDGGAKTRSRYAEALVPLLAFSGTLAGIFLWQTGLRFEFQFAAAGGFIASCLLAYLAWVRPRKDIVSLSTPIYGFVFMVTPIDYVGGIALQLIYAAGLTGLVIRLHYRFGAGEEVTRKELAAGPLRTYVDSTRDAFATIGPDAGRSAAMAFLHFAEGEYRKAADVSHAAVFVDGSPEPLVRAFTILRQHAELLDKNLPRPVTYLEFLPDDVSLMAKPLRGEDTPDQVFETMLDNALLLVYCAAWHASGGDRPSLLASQAFAGRLLES